MPVKSPQHRPPQDLSTPMLPIVDGCSHGKCHFCNIFNGIPFTMLPEEEIVSDIEQIAKSATALTNRIYLTGGNPFALPVKKLVNIFDEVEKRIPSVKSYGGFCCIKDVKRKSDEELAILASRGVNEIALGAESGFDEALAFMEKGHTAADIVEQGQRLHEAGINFTFFYLTGIAGAGRGQENAIASAKAFSAAKPNRILVVTMTPHADWPLAKDIAEGKWVPPTEMEMLEEIRTLIEHLDCRCSLNCSHDTDILKFEGMLPERKQQMLDLMNNLMPKVNEKASRRIREMLEKGSFEVPVNTQADTLATAS